MDNESTSTSALTTDASSSSGPASSTGAGESTSESSGADGKLPAAPLEPGELRPGGDTTVDETGAGAFSLAAANLRIDRRAPFEAGLQFFQLNWEVAPGTPEFDGLGPTFNAASCLSCHVRNGRGLVPDNENITSPGVLLRLGSASGAPDPLYGSQLQPLAVQSVPREGELVLELEDAGLVKLGSQTVELVRLVYTLRSGDLGPLDSATGVSPRLSPQVIGMGLLEAVPAGAIYERHDPDDTNADGISGRVALLDNDTIGRFGWKSGQSSVRAQNSGALLGDLGITTAERPQENCPRGQTECSNAPSGGTPEFTATRLDAMTTYVSLLGVPARRGGDEPATLQGKYVFEAIGCEDCHRKSFTTATAAEPELENQTIWPYTDLLLHDMGSELADPMAEGDAQPAEWRTPPLWGLGLLETVSTQRRLLHDGRARTLAEAIVWHGGEAQHSRNAYVELTDLERQRLHTFLESL